MRRFLRTVMLGCVSVFVAGTAFAQDYPSQPVTLIVPNDAGSGFDVTARMFTPKLSEVLGQSVVIENIPGAGSIVGTQKAAEARPDGYTILIINVTHTATEALYKNLSYSLIDSFDPVLRFANTFYVFAVNPKVGAKTFSEFVDFAKAHPGELNYSSAGLGSPTFMATALLNSAAGLDMTHIPYEGGGQAVASIVAGETDFYAAPYTTAKPFFEDGKLRPLAVSSPRRSSFLPDLPPASDKVPGYELTSWYGLLLPKGTPVEIRDRIRAAMVETLADPAVKKGMDGLAIETFDEGPEEFGAFLVKEIATMKQIVKDSGIEPK